MIDLVVLEVILSARFKTWLSCIMHFAGNQIHQIMLWTYYTKTSIFVTILKMWVIETMVMIIYLIKLQIWRQFLPYIIVDVIVIVFYKVIYYGKVVFNLATIEYFVIFWAKILVILFTMIYCNMSKYQSKYKIIKLLDIEIA